MAEKLASLRKKGGGKMSETVLWTNPSPTSAFAAQSVALSDNISKYKYICIKVWFSTSRNDILTSIYDTSEITRCIYNSTYVTPSAGIWRTDARHTRDMYYVDDTHFGFYDDQRILGSSVTTSNTALIPYQIIGLK